MGRLAAGRGKGQHSLIRVQPAKAPQRGRLDPRVALAAAPPGYRLSIPDSACDLGRFIAEKTEGVQAAAAGRFEQVGKHLSAALAEWRWQVLEDLRDFQFVDTFATSLVEEEDGISAIVGLPDLPGSPSTPTALDDGLESGDLRGGC